MRNYGFKYERIMREIMFDAHNKNFICGKVRVPVGVDPSDLKKDISVFFANVYRRGEWIYYNTSRK